MTNFGETQKLMKINQISKRVLILSIFHSSLFIQPKRKIEWKAKEKVEAKAYANKVIKTVHFFLFATKTISNRSLFSPWRTIVFLFLCFVKFSPFFSFKWITLDMVERIKEQSYWKVCGSRFLLFLHVSFIVIIFIVYTNNIPRIPLPELLYLYF